MTAIIVIVVVALVFFVTVCVVSFMVWKRETEMRTDSIRAIENSLNEVLYELSSTDNSNDKVEMRGYKNNIKSTKTFAGNNIVNKDPFEWVKDEESKRSRVIEKLRAKRSAGEMEADAETAGIENMKIFRPSNSHRSNLRWKVVYGDDVEVTDTGPGDISATQDIKQETEKPEEKQVKPVEEPVDAKIPEKLEEDEINEIKETKEINLDFADDFDDDFFEEFNEEFTNEFIDRTDYDVGRSGKKYTTSELETLIKE